MYEKKRPKTAEEYVKLVEQAIIEIEEARACADFDVEESAEDALRFLVPVEQELRDMRATMADGSYYFGNDDLNYMPLVTRFSRLIPFADLLKLINDTHRQGLDV